MLYLVVGYPRSGTTITLKALVHIINPSHVIYELLHDYTVKAQLRRGEVRHDSGIRVKSNLSSEHVNILRMFYTFSRLYVSARAGEWVRLYVKALKLVDELSPVCAGKCVFSWTLPNYLEIPKSCRLVLLTFRPLKQVLRDYIAFYSNLTPSGFLRSMRTFIRSRAFRRAVQCTVTFLGLNRRRRNLYGLKLMCAWLCGVARCRDVEKIVECTYAQYVDRCIKLTEEFNNVRTIQIPFIDNRERENIRIVMVQVLKALRREYV